MTNKQQKDKMRANMQLLNYPRLRKQRTARVSIFDYIVL
jgi:hypothetical protein